MDYEVAELQKKHNIFILPALFKTGFDIGVGFGSGFALTMCVFLLITEIVSYLWGLI